MIDCGRWYPVLPYSAFVWHESGENLVLFCYLIGWGTFAMLRSRKLAPIPNYARHEAACSNPFSTFFIHSTVPKGSEN
jgi:hypothetical protein